MSTADLLAKLRYSLAGEPDVVPKGWKCSEQLAKEWGMSAANARRLTRAGLRDGILESKRFRVQHGGKPYPLAHYRPAPRKKITS